MSKWMVIGPASICSGSDVNKPRKMRETPLHGACMTGDVKLVKLLLDNGAKLDAKTVVLDTPLHTAAAFDKADVIRFLVKRYHSDYIVGFHLRVKVSGCGTRVEQSDFAL